MPTGFTADVADGKVTDFRTFALRCARAFGATIMQREHPMNEPPTLREESSYYAESVERDEKRVAELVAMTLEEADRAAQAEYDAAVAYLAEQKAKRTEMRNRYNAMLAEVMAWEPPTPDHEGMKKFMVEQLTTGREFDCTVYGETPTRMDAGEWLGARTTAAYHALARSRESLREERCRVADANRWITTLYDSLQSVPA